MIAVCKTLQGSLTLLLTFREVLSIYRMQNHLEAYATGSIRLKNFIVKVRALLVGRLASACAAKVNA